jgi:hypothetical protein
VLCAGEGNKSPTLRFDTVWSGELTVSPCSDGSFVMGLPRYEVTADVPAGAGADSTLVRVTRPLECDLLLCFTDICRPSRLETQEVVGDSALAQEVLYCKVLPPVLARPGQGCAARQPEAKHAACGMCSPCRDRVNMHQQSTAPVRPRPLHCAQALTYLVVVLHPHAGRGALEALHPDTARLRQAYTGGEIMSIIVTAAGANSKCLWLHGLL